MTRRDDRDLAGTWITINGELVLKENIGSVFSEPRNRTGDESMSAPQGPSAAEQIRCGTAPIYRHLRYSIAILGRAIDDVSSLLIVHFTYGSEGTPVGLYELTFRDKTTQRWYWHFERQVVLSDEAARGMLDLARLPDHERQFLEEAPTRRQSLQPTSSKRPGEAYHVTYRLNDRTITFQKPIPDPFIRGRVRVGLFDLLRGLFRGQLTVEVIVGGDKDRVDAVLRLDEDR